MAELPFLAGEEGRGHVLALLFFLSVFLTAVWGSWQGSLPASDEAVLAQIANEVPHIGRALPLRFDGAPVHDTPPFAPWFMALMYGRFGTNNFAARFAFVLLSIGAVYMTFLAGRAASRDWDAAAGERSPAATDRACSHSHWGSLSTAAGFFSAVALAASPLFGRFMPHVTLGLPFAFFAALGLLGWLELPRSRAGRYLWGTAVVGGVLSAGAGGFLLVPAAILAGLFDRERRSLWRTPGFALATLGGALIGGIWIGVETSRGGLGFFDNALWAPIARVIRPPDGAPRALLVSLAGVWLGNLPWSVPATIACARIAFFRNRGPSEARAGGLDAALLVFAAALFVPLALGGADTPGVFLPVLPFIAVLSAREVARWIGRPGCNLAGRLWALNHVATAIYCLVMLLVVATPIRIRKTAEDPIQSVAEMAGRIVPAGERVGNFGQPYRVQCARMLFYGERALGARLSDAEEVAAALRDNPRMIFLSSARDLETLRSSSAFPHGIRVLYGAGDLVLFGARNGGADTIPGIRHMETEAR